MEIGTAHMGHIKRIGMLYFEYMRIAVLVLAVTAIVLAVVAYARTTTYVVPVSVIAATMSAFAFVAVMRLFIASRINDATDRRFSFRRNSDSAFAAAATIFAALLGAAGVALWKGHREREALQDEVRDLRASVLDEPAKAHARRYDALRPDTSDPAAYQSSHQAFSVDVDSGTLLLEVRGCRPVANGITCELAITSRKGLASFALVASPDLQQNSIAKIPGGVWQADDARIGTAMGHVPQIALAPDVTVRATIRFRGSPANVAAFEKLKLVIKLLNVQYELIFENVPVSAG
jgi:hypothetical protein